MDAVTRKRLLFLGFPRTQKLGSCRQQEETKANAQHCARQNERGARASDRRENRNNGDGQGCTPHDEPRLCVRSSSEDRGGDDDKEAGCVRDRRMQIRTQQRVAPARVGIKEIEEGHGEHPSSNSNQT
jgi:hypothetical protein